MNRRPHNREAGFSFIELLVTIVITGIVFGAMVPLFVQAEKGGTTDKLRLISGNIAQDRIEKIRELDFELVDAVRLSNNDVGYPGSEFGSSWTEDIAEGIGTRTFDVAYVIVNTYVPNTNPQVISYKTVTVKVRWQGSPQPAPWTQISTIVYRQSAGPRIDNFAVAPWDASNDWITSSTVSLTAVINPGDLETMQPVTVGSLTVKGRVEFLITPVGGAPLPAKKVYYNSASSTPGTFTATWLVEGGNGVGDGSYDFRAIAYTAQGYPGTALTFTKRVESGPPAPVTALAGAGNTTSAMLTWARSISLDLDHYEIYRLDPLDSVPHLIQGDPSVLPKFTDLGYTDSGLTTGNTYVYTVYAVDQVGNKSSAATVSVIADDPGSIPPLPASALTGTATSGGYIRLAWTASPTADVTSYQIFKHGDGTTVYTTAGVTMKDILQGYGTTEWYQLKPVRSTGAVGTVWSSIGTTTPAQLTQDVSGTLWVKVSLAAQPLYTLNIKNTTGKTLTSLKMYFLGLTGTAGKTLVTPTYTTVIANQIKTWASLPEGKYQWDWAYSPNKSGSQVGWCTGAVMTVSGNTP